MTNLIRSAAVCQGTVSDQKQQHRLYRGAGAVTENKTGALLS